MVGEYHLGKAVQVDSIKPTLNPPGTKRLKLKNMINCFQFCFNFTFKFNLRCYTSGSS